MSELRSFLLIFFLTGLIVSCDAILTQAPESGEAFDEPLSGLTQQELGRSRVAMKDSRKSLP